MGLLWELGFSGGCSSSQLQLFHRAGWRVELALGQERLCWWITVQLLCLLQMQEKAKEIYMTFLSNKASSQVNVEGQSRLSEKILEEPHPLMFQKLQDQVM